MKKLLFSILVFATPAWGESEHHHHHHHEEMKPTSSKLPENSVFQLGAEWTDQNGIRHALSKLRGKPRLVAMLFTHCETACPLIVEDLMSIQKKLPKPIEKELQVTIFSIDSERDTPEALTVFARKRKLPSDWLLLTGDSSAVAELAAALGVRYKKLPDGSFLHSNLIFYLNEKGVVRTRKEGLKTSSKKFIQEIAAFEKD